MLAALLAALKVTLRFWLKNAKAAKQLPQLAALAALSIFDVL
jgi:hypothetical protein